MPSDTGLLRTSYAPAFIASTVISCVPHPVVRITMRFRIEGLEARQGREPVHARQAEVEHGVGPEALEQQKASSALPAISVL